MFPSLTQYLSVADNARDAVLLHVSASSEKQECENETGELTKTTECQIITHSGVCGPKILCFYKVEHLLVQRLHITLGTHTITVDY
jgi:hypothetical protein